MSQLGSEPPDKGCHSDLLELPPGERSAIFQCIKTKRDHYVYSEPNLYSPRSVVLR